jgi:histidinol phosphatase-like PHP family hydrolase
VAVEINGFPRRQDLDWELARLAVGAGCDFLLASDAHATTHLEFDAYACAIAIKAGIPRERVLNAGQVDPFTAWLADR